MTTRKSAQKAATTRARQKWYAERNKVDRERGEAFMAALAAINETREGKPLHHGGYVWINGAEQRWECDDDCPHLSHDEDQA